VGLSIVECHPISTNVLDSSDIAEGTCDTGAIEESSMTSVSRISHVDSSESLFDDDHSRVRFPFQLIY
jgi:hypothetical protein